MPKAKEFDLGTMKIVLGSGGAEEGEEERKEKGTEQEASSSAPPQDQGQQGQGQQGQGQQGQGKQGQQGSSAGQESPDSGRDKGQPGEDQRGGSSGDSSEDQRGPEGAPGKDPSSGDKPGSKGEDSSETQKGEKGGAGGGADQDKGKGSEEGEGGDSPSGSSQSGSSQGEEGGDPLRDPNRNVFYRPPAEDGEGGQGGQGGQGGEEGEEEEEDGGERKKITVRIGDPGIPVDEDDRQDGKKRPKVEVEVEGQPPVTPGGGKVGGKKKKSQQGGGVGADTEKEDENQEGKGGGKEGNKDGRGNKGGKEEDKDEKGEGEGGKGKDGDKKENDSKKMGGEDGEEGDGDKDRESEGKEGKKGKDKGKDSKDKSKEGDEEGEDGLKKLDKEKEKELEKYSSEVSDPPEHSDRNPFEVFAELNRTLSGETVSTDELSKGNRGLSISRDGQVKAFEMGRLVYKSGRALKMEVPPTASIQHHLALSIAYILEALIKASAPALDPTEPDSPDPVRRARRTSLPRGQLVEGIRLDVDRLISSVDLSGSVSQEQAARLIVSYFAALAAATSAGGSARLRSGIRPTAPSSKKVEVVSLPFADHVAVVYATGPISSIHHLVFRATYDEAIVSVVGQGTTAPPHMLAHLNRILRLARGANPSAYTSGSYVPMILISDFLWSYEDVVGLASDIRRNLENKVLFCVVTGDEGSLEKAEGERGSWEGKVLRTLLSSSVFSAAMGLNNPRRVYVSAQLFTLMSAFGLIEKARSSGISFVSSASVSV